MIGDVLSLLEHQFEKGSIKVRRELARRRRCTVIGLRVQAAAGVPQPVPQRARRDAERRLADDRDARRRRRSGRRSVATPATAFRAEHLARIYDPFFTTKADRPGHRPRPVDHLRHRARARRRRSTATARPARARGSRCASRPRRPTGRRATQRQRAQVSDMRRNALDPRHRRRGNHAGDSRDAAGARGLQRAPGRRAAQEGLELAQVAAVRRRHRRRDDAGHRRPAGARRAAEARRRAAGHR